MTNPTITHIDTTLLKQLISQLDSFKSLLEQEAFVLKSNETQALFEISQQKEALATQVEACYQQFIQKLSPDLAFSLAEIIQLPLFNQFSPADQALANDALQLMEACHNLNLSNGMTIQALNNLNTSLLQMINGQDASAKVYGAKGKTTNTTIPTSKTLGTA